MHFSLPSLLCVLPAINQLYMLCVWPPFNLLHLSLFNPYCVYGPHSFFHPCCVYGQIQPAAHLSLPSMLCVLPAFSQSYLSLLHPCFVYWPHSTSRAFLSFIHVVCMAPIQPAVPSSLSYMLCVWPPFNQPCLPLFHPCCVYGPHSTSRAFLSFIHVVCMAPIQLAVPSSLSYMLCVWPPFNQPCLPLFHPCCVYGPHSTSRAFLSFIHVVCMAPFNQTYLSLFHPCCVYSPYSTSNTFIFSSHVVCIAPI